MNAADEPTAARRWTPLEAIQRRVLGVLIEKAKTTPAGYPMTVNAIVTGCNQKSNRDPLTSYDDFDVEKTLTELQTLGVVKEIDWVGRVPKYKHLAYEWLGVNPMELAVLAELLLRGPQALGELRARAARMEPIEDLPALRPIVEGLVARTLMIELTPAGRGQIVSHNLYPSGELAALRAPHGKEPGRDVPMAREAGEVSGPAHGAAGPHMAEHSTDRPATREAAPSTPDVLTEIATLRDQVARLVERVEKLESQTQ